MRPSVPKLPSSGCDETETLRVIADLHPVHEAGAARRAGRSGRLRIEAREVARDVGTIDIVAAAEVLPAGPSGLPTVEPAKILTGNPERTVPMPASAHPASRVRTMWFFELRKNGISQVCVMANTCRTSNWLDA